MAKKSWYGFGFGDTLEEVKHFGDTMPQQFNLDFLVYAEGPKEAFKIFYTQKAERLEKELTKAKALATLY